MKVILGHDNGFLRSCDIPSHCFHSKNIKNKEALSKLNNESIEKIKLTAIKLGLNLIESKPNYLYLTSKSKVFGFIDDVEFFYIEGVGLQFRSSSRVGHSDLGANKERVQKILETALNINI